MVEVQELRARELEQEREKRCKRNRCDRKPRHLQQNKEVVNKLKNMRKIKLLHLLINIYSGKFHIFIAKLKKSINI